MNQPEASSAGWIDLAISLLLRLGVLFSALVLLIGGGIYLVRHGTEAVADRSQFKQEPPEYSHPGAIIAAARAGQGRAMVQLGLLLLIATPVLRVAFTLVAFAIKRDLVYVIIAGLVLAVLMVGFSGVVVGR